MMDVAYFKERAGEAERILATLTSLAASITGRPCRVDLLPRLDDEARARIMSLNDDVFGGRRDVFDTRALHEVEEDPDALFLVLEVDGTIEAGVFGYYEDPPGEIVEGTDFFLDSAMVSPAWQAHGLGELGGIGVLLLLELIADVHSVGVAVWSDGDVEKLVDLYRRFGFVDAVGHGMPHRCMRVTLDPERVGMWRDALGMTHAGLAGG